MNSRIASVLLAATIASAVPGSAQAMNCGAVLDELSKAIAGHLTMSTSQKAAMLRMVMSTYDRCEAGDTANAGATRDMLMEQLRKSLGGR